MRQPVIPLLLGTVGGAAACAAVYQFLWQHAFPGAQANRIETFGLVLMAFTGAVFGGLGASVDLPARELARQWRLLIALAALLVIDILVQWQWELGYKYQRLSRYDFIVGSLFLGYLIRRAYDALAGAPTPKGLAWKSQGLDERG